jgi:hypothetical protein
MQIDSDQQSDTSNGLKRKIPDAASVQPGLPPTNLPEPSSRSTFNWVAIHHKISELEQFPILSPDITVIFTLVPEAFHLPPDFDTSVDFTRPSTDKPKFFFLFCFSVVKIYSAYFSTNTPPFTLLFLSGISVELALCIVVIGIKFDCFELEIRNSIFPAHLSEFIFSGLTLPFH